MSIELLNVEKVNEAIDSRGLKRTWVIEKIGERRAYGFVLLREGLLPKDPEHKARIISRLSALLGLEPSQVVQTLVAKVG